MPFTKVPAEVLACLASPLQLRDDESLRRLTAAKESLEALRHHQSSTSSISSTAPPGLLIPDGFEDALLQLGWQVEATKFSLQCEVAELERLRKIRDSLRQRCVMIDSDRQCEVCGGSITSAAAAKRSAAVGAVASSSSAALVVYPNLKVAHSECAATVPPGRSPTTKLPFTFPL